MNFILDGKHIVVDNNSYYIYLHSDHVIIHLKNSPTENCKIYYQIDITGNFPDWENGFASSGTTRVSCVLPDEIKQLINRYLSNSAFW